MNAPNHAERILAAVDHGFDERLRFLSDLVSMPSLRGAEGTVQDFIAAAMRVKQQPTPGECRVRDRAHCRIS